MTFLDRIHKFHYSKISLTLITFKRFLLYLYNCLITFNHIIIKVIEYLDFFIVYTSKTNLLTKLTESKNTRIKSE